MTAMTMDREISLSTREGGKGGEEQVTWLMEGRREGKRMEGKREKGRKREKGEGRR